MPTVTVAGAHGETVKLSFDSNANAALARKLAAAITAGVQSGAIVPAEDTDGPPPGLPPGTTGEFVQKDSDGPTVLPTGYKAYVNVAKEAMVFASDDTDQSILSSKGDLTFDAAGGSGTIVAGGGDNRIILREGVTGDWSVNTGKGDDTVRALGSGNDTVNAGRGHNAIMLGGGSDWVSSSGDDTVSAGDGQATIAATGSGRVLIYGNAADLYFIGTRGSATLYGGTGSDTFEGGSGNNLVYGGSGGNNVLYAGSGKATLFGGGDGDRLYAEGSKRQELHAGDGNVTLSGVMGRGANTFYAGSGHTQIIGGTGNDTIVGGTGAATASGGGGKDIFLFVDGRGGGTQLIEDFDKGKDKIDLDGYGKKEVSKALRSQQESDGSTTITLSDDTTITFVGITHLSAKDFVDGNGGGKGQGHGGHSDGHGGHGKGHNDRNDHGWIREVFSGRSHD